MIKSNKSAIDKLTALWALNESGLGGFMHIFNTPFTGLIVGGLSILFISLIAYYADNKAQSIFKALVVVLIIKMAVSPYSPLGAYVAVSFQGALGILLFSNFSWKGLTLVALGVLTFLESALQKLLILTIIYGTELWEAINIYGQWVQKKIDVFIDSSASSLLITIYLSVYGLSGIVAGLFIKSIIKIIAEKEEEDFYLEVKDKKTLQSKSKGTFKAKLIWIWLATVSIIVLSFTFFGDTTFGWQKGVYVLFRSLLIIMFWYVVIGPFLLRMMRRYLEKKESLYKDDVANAMDLLPYFRQIIRHTWKETKHLKGYNRFKYFIANSISNCIHFKA
ncbi:hypothetical protein [Winogradskyella aurantia]|uniref:Uncharacterized protein n=1 Tax=Winogradskyella aurantia TaxID=1915063 RepID=A0A265UZJ1_9FLAO|nr:hypothetical protein [Winogradskyella aurantia]OZV70725.1 hypothetical protein CA834_01020 [Winogradskyella aurantia]